MIKTSMAFSRSLDTPAFATVLLIFIKSPTPKAWKRYVNKAMADIEAAGIKGLWWPEIAFKEDQPKQIDEKTFGLSSERRHLVHLHGIVDLKDHETLHTLFPQSNQVRVEEIGIGKYACMTFQQNITCITRYSTKKDWRKDDVSIIEANPEGFGYRTTEEKV